MVTYNVKHLTPEHFSVSQLVICWVFPHLRVTPTITSNIPYDNSDILSHHYHILPPSNLTTIPFNHKQFTISFSINTPHMPGPVLLAASAAYQRYLQDGETGNIALPAYEQVGIY